LTTPPKTSILPLGSRAARPSGDPRLVSVIVPVCNEEEHLSDQLEALAGQTYRGAWELLIVDNGSRDRSVEIAESYAPRLPLRIVDASARRGINHARNAGVAAASGDFVAFCDGDDVVSPGWLDALVRAASAADIVTGPLEFLDLNDSLSLAWRPNEALENVPLAHDFLPYASGGNCGMWIGVAREIRWNGDFRFGSCDTEFSWRAQLAGYTIGFAPEAVIHLRYRMDLRGLASQYFSYGKSGALLYRNFREHGMSWDRQNARDRWRWIAEGSRGIVSSVERRGNWVRMASFSLGRAWGSVRWRVRFF
jgi:glycosyltransferase involved in cell wall biosynthesis